MCVIPSPFCQLLPFEINDVQKAFEFPPSANHWGVLLFSPPGVQQASVYQEAFCLLTFCLISESELRKSWKSILERHLRLQG